MLANVFWGDLTIVLQECSKLPWPKCLLDIDQCLNQSSPYLRSDSMVNILEPPSVVLTTWNSGHGIRSLGRHHIIDHRYRYASKLQQKILESEMAALARDWRSIFVRQVESKKVGLLLSFMCHHNAYITWVYA
jgi:hypothetical protein